MVHSSFIGLLEVIMSEQKIKLEDCLMSDGFELGVCEIDEKDYFIVRTFGKIGNTENQVNTSLIPINGLQDIVFNLFSLGFNYQEETGNDIGFNLGRSVDDHDDKE
jgi:hypothetical protein